jgi:hypothetical protein
MNSLGIGMLVMLLIRAGEKEEHRAGLNEHYKNIRADPFGPVIALYPTEEIAWPPPNPSIFPNEKTKTISDFSIFGCGVTTPAIIQNALPLNCLCIREKFVVGSLPHWSMKMG